METRWAIATVVVMLVVGVIIIGAIMASRADRRREATNRQTAVFESERAAWTTLLEQAAHGMASPLSEPSADTAAARLEIRTILQAAYGESAEDQARANRLIHVARSLNLDPDAIRRRSETDESVAHLRADLVEAMNTSRNQSAAAEARLSALETILIALDQRDADIVARVLRDYDLSATDGDLLEQLRQRYLDIRSRYLEDLLTQGWNAIDDAALTTSLSHIGNLLRRHRWSIERLQLSDIQLATYYRLLVRLPERTDDQLIDRERLMQLAVVLLATDTDATDELRLAFDVIAFQILADNTANALDMGTVMHARLLHDLWSRLSDLRIEWLKSHQSATAHE